MFNAIRRHDISCNVKRNNSLGCLCGNTNTLDLIAVCDAADWLAAERYFCYRLGPDESPIEAFHFCADARAKTIIEKALTLGFQEVEYNRNTFDTLYAEKINQIFEIEICGRKLAEILSFEGISLLQFIPERCYDLYPCQNILFIEYAAGLIEQYTPQKLRVVGNLDPVSVKTLALIAKKYDIPVEYLEVGGGTIKPSSCEWKPDVLKTGIPARQEIGRRLNIRNYAKTFGNCRSVPDSNNVLFMAYPRSLWSRADGTYYDDIYDSFRDFCDVNKLRPIRVEVPYYYQIKGDDRDYVRLVKTGRPGGFDGAFLDEYLDDGMVSEIERLKAELETKFLSYSQDKEFRDVFSWKGIDFFETLGGFWYDLFVRHLACECVLSMLAARKMIEALKPSVIFACYEAGAYARAVIIESHRAGIPSFGLQHAAIHEQILYYRLRNLNHHPDLSRPCYDIITPDKTLVFGTAYKDYLTRTCHYQDDAVEVTGIDWRLLNTPSQYMDACTQKELKTKWFGDKKVAVVLTSLSTISALKHLASKLSPAEWIILIKLHPHDPNTALYTEILKENGFSFYITKDYLYESLVAADVVFAAACSTTILDALYYGKPTYYYENFSWPYSEPWRKMAVNMYSVSQYEQHGAFYEKEAKIKKYLESIGYCRNTDIAVFTSVLNRTIGKVIRQKTDFDLCTSYEALAFFRKENEKYKDIRSVNEGYRDMNIEYLFENIIHQVYFELSNLCNYADVHKKCPVHIMQKSHQILPSKVIYDALDLLRAMRFKGKIGFHTYNEPLMDPRLCCFISAVRNACPECTIYLCTNGYYLNQALAEELVQLGVDWFHVSAYSDEEYNRLGRIQVAAQYEVQKMRLDDRICFYESAVIDKKEPCYAPFYQLIITADAKVGLCCLDWRRRFSFGDLTRQTLKDVLQDPYLTEIYSQLSQGNRNFDFCRRCSWPGVGINEPEFKGVLKNQKSGLVSING